MLIIPEMLTTSCTWNFVLMGVCITALLYIFESIYHEKKVQKVVRWSSIPPISTLRTITSHLNSLNRNRPQYMTLEIQVLAWNRHTNIVGLNG